MSAGGLQCMSQLIKFDQSTYGASSDISRITMRRYSCMTLTNLTFGDSNNKVPVSYFDIYVTFALDDAHALPVWWRWYDRVPSLFQAQLCAMQGCLDAIVHQLQSFNEDLCQVAASVIRNLSWKADQASKRHLRLSQAANKLMITALQVNIDYLRPSEIDDFAIGSCPLMHLHIDTLRLARSLH